MFLEFFIIIFLSRYLRQFLQTSSKLQEWNKILTGVMYVAIGLLVLDVTVPATKPVMMWVAHLMCLLIVAAVFRQNELRNARPVMYAVLPLILISLLKDLIESLNADLYSKIDEYLDTAMFFAVVWMIAMWFITKKQRKALEKERKKRLEEEEEHKVVAGLKAELEDQVAERTSELMQQKEELQQALNELKSTQVQLIQQEKMASLGELTAGIAHEIQNPLNFVNNFSELSMELVTELKEEIEKPDLNKVLITELAADLSKNQEKINSHGKRADAIVKGMLQHSRSSTGKKEPTDLNALADEYLRLSYHGLRAKDKLFNATMHTAFDQSVGRVNIIAQDLGRVLLNLFNNAFYAVAEKKKQQGETFTPAVWVDTKKTPTGVEIRIRDNGMGIPQKVLDKIFQPFFTTKPTGQGTGLGLSLSYDIITKGHGGQLKVETKEGEYAVFIIYIPSKENS
jgi:signal transduction histidine kinase